MTSSNRVKFIRKNVLNLSVQKFGDALGFSRSYVADIEAERTEPSYRFVQALLNVYGVNINWIVEGKGEMFIEYEKVTDNQSNNLQQQKDSDKTISSVMEIAIELMQELKKVEKTNQTMIDTLANALTIEQHSSR